MLAVEAIADPSAIGNPVPHAEAANAAASDAAPLNAHETAAPMSAAEDDVAAAPTRPDQQLSPGQETNMPVAANSGRSVNGLLAVLHGLSEEELIALFS